MGSHVNGMLFDPNALCVARNPYPDMMIQGDAKGVMEDNTTKTEAWKRRRNQRHDEKMVKGEFESNTTKTEAWKRRRNRRGGEAAAPATTGSTAPGGPVLPLDRHYRSSSHRYYRRRQTLRRPLCPDRYPYRARYRP